MGSLQELEKELQLKDEKIHELRQLVEAKDELIQQLMSKLDKFQSVLPQTQTSLISRGPRKQRAQGISAEPHSVAFNGKDVQDGNNFLPVAKPERPISL